MHVGAFMTADRVPQNHQRPHKPCHRVRPLHTPFTPDPQIVQAEMRLAVEERQFDTPAAAVALDHERRRDARVGRHQHLVRPRSRHVADQDHDHRIGLAGVIPEHITHLLNPQGPLLARQGDLLQLGWVGRGVFDHRFRRGQAVPLLAGGPASLRLRRFGPGRAYNAAFHGNGPNIGTFEGRFFSTVALR